MENLEQNKTEIEKLVSQYVFNVMELEDFERARYRPPLSVMLEFNERFERTILELERAISDEYDLDFDGTCDCKAQEKLNELCDIEFSKLKPKL